MSFQTLFTKMEDHTLIITINPLTAGYGALHLSPAAVTGVI